MKAAPIIIVVMVVAILVLGLMGFSAAWSRLGQLESQVNRMESEVRAIGGWAGQFVELPYGETVDGYVAFGWYAHRADAIRFATSIANIKTYGVMVLQPTGDGYWQVLRKFD